jgi:S-adenosylmethionine:tRNA ribosyltransferase-isomerase
MSDTILIQHYTYDLPPDRIAAHPLTNRDESKLLVYNKGNIQHSGFKSIVDFLPSNSFLFFNDTKVIPARIHFQKETGAEIEIFLLTPLKPSIIMAEVMLAHKICAWQCTIGNLKRWKDDQTLTKVVNGISLQATLINRTEGIVEFSWESEQSFAEMITVMGVTPLPPYIKRDASVEDVNRYQTIYSHYEGAVAAPTAGLHFTDNIMELLQRKGIKKDFLTLHVSAGTFQPVKAENALDHSMHHEQVVITKKTIENLLAPNQFTVAVGTTSMRTLESLYWHGVQLLENSNSDFLITQYDPYQKRKLYSRNEALLAILNSMDKKGIDFLTGSTSIFIYPGYEFRICNALITNFHLPASTLILLVAALVGNDWRKIYDEALANDYRFLSYGDSSLLIPSSSK